MTDFWEQARIPDNLEQVKEANEKSDKLQELHIINNKIKEEELKSKSNKAILQELLNKISQLQFLKETENMPIYKNNESIEKDKSHKKLITKLKDLKSIKNITSTIKKKYELSLLQSDSHQNNTHQTHQDLVKENNKLKLKIKDLNIVNNSNMKEIEHLEDYDYYPNIISQFQNELNQLIHKKTDYDSKIIKNEKSVNVLKEILNNILKENYEDLYNSDKGKEFIKENNIEEIQSHLNAENINYKTLETLFLTESNLQHSKKAINGKLSVYTNNYNGNRNKSLGKYGVPDKKSIGLKNNILPPLENRRKTNSPPIVNTYNKGRLQLAPMSNILSSKNTRKNNTAVYMKRVNDNNEDANSKANYNKYNSKYNVISEKEGQKLLEDNNEYIEYEDCENEQYNGLESKYDKLKTFFISMNKSALFQDKTIKKKINELSNIKQHVSEKVIDIKEENDLLSREIDFLTLQLNEFSKNINLDKLMNKGVMSKLAEQKLKEENEIEDKQENVEDNLINKNLNLKNKSKSKFGSKKISYKEFIRNKPVQKPEIKESNEIITVTASGKNISDFESNNKIAFSEVNINKNNDNLKHLDSKNTLSSENLEFKKDDLVVNRHSFNENEIDKFINQSQIEKVDDNDTKDDVQNVIRDNDSRENVEAQSNYYSRENIEVYDNEKINCSNKIIANEINEEKDLLSEDKKSFIIEINQANKSKEDKESQINGKHIFKNKENEDDSNEENNQNEDDNDDYENNDANENSDSNEDNDHNGDNEDNENNDDEECD